MDIYIYGPQWNEIEKACNFGASAFGKNLKESRRSLFDRSFFIKKKLSKKNFREGVNKIITMKIAGLKCLCISIIKGL